LTQPSFVACTTPYIGNNARKKLRPDHRRGRVGTGLALSFADAVRRRRGEPQHRFRAPIARRVRSARRSRRRKQRNGPISFPDRSRRRDRSGRFRIRWRADVACVHCSGAADLDLLGKAAAEGALVGGFHRCACSASPEILRHARLRHRDRGTEALARELERLRARSARGPCGCPRRTSALHAAANFSGAFVVALIAETVRFGKSWHRRARRNARAAAVLRGSVDNVEELARRALSAAWWRAATSYIADILRRSRKPRRTAGALPLAQPAHDSARDRQGHAEARDAREIEA